MFSLVACVSMLACTSNEPSNPDGSGGTGGEDGTGGSTTTAGNTGTGGGTGGEGGDTDSGGNTGTGGSGGSGGAGGGTGGDGGSPPVGPCDAIDADDIAVVYTAPSEHADGNIAISAYVQCAPGSEAVCTNVSWSDPFVGCTAAADVDVITCVFGSYPTGTKVYYITGVDTGNTPALDVWFSWLVGNQITKVGTHLVCHGSEIIGAYDGNTFSGALSDTDQANNANQMILVP
ncbi:hypothetical protein KBC59_00605 [Patescibacteria group bacterium]|nr:hypothetical protein [Patescibacteria group bacterium]